MAKKRRSTALAPRTTVVRMPAPRAAAPIIRVSAPRAAPLKRRSHRRRASSNGLGSMNGVVGNALGGMIFGYAVKQGYVDKLPAIPVLGRTGTAALILDYYGKHGGGDWARRAAMAAAVLAGYQLGSEGVVHGDASPDDD